MNDVCLIQTVFDLTCFDVVDCFCNIHGYCACLGVGHQAFRTQHTTQTANNAHHIGSCYCNVETEPVFILNLRNQILCAYEIRTCCKCFFSLCTLCEYQYTNCFTCTVRKNYGTTNLLISMSAVNTQTNMCFYCSVKFCSRCFLYQIDCICCIIQHCAIYELSCLAIFFTSFHFRDLLMW